MSSQTAATAKTRKPPERGEAGERVLRSLPVRVARWTSGAVGFVATLLGVVFVLFPAVKPDDPPSSQGAQLTNPDVERLTWGQYLDREDLDRGPYDAHALRRRGIFVEFDFAIEGYKDKDLPLRWQLIDARDGDQLAKSRDEIIEPEVSEDRGSSTIWMPLSGEHPRSVYVQLQLYEETGKVAIGRIRTPPFSPA